MGDRFEIGDRVYVPPQISIETGRIVQVGVHVYVVRVPGIMSCLWLYDRELSEAPA